MLNHLRSAPVIFQNFTLPPPSHNGVSLEQGAPNFTIYDANKVLLAENYLAEVGDRISARHFGAFSPIDRYMLPVALRNKYISTKSEWVREEIRCRATTMRMLLSLGSELEPINERYYNRTDVPVIRGSAKYPLNEAVNPLNLLKPHVKSVLEQGMSIRHEPAKKFHVGEHIHHASTENRKNIALLEHHHFTLERPDNLWIKSLFDGFNIIGRQESSGGVWVPEYRPGKLIEKDLLEYYSRKDFKLRAAPPGWNDFETLHKVWTKAEALRERGWSVRISPQEIKREVSYTFGVLQPTVENPTKTRLITHQKACNDFTWNSDKIRMPGLSIILELVRLYSAEIGSDVELQRLPLVQSRKSLALQIQFETSVRKVMKSHNISIDEARTAIRGEFPDKFPIAWDDERMKEVNNTDNLVEHRSFRDKQCVTDTFSDDQVAGVAKADWIEAYFQFAVNDPDLNIVAVWQDKDWVPKDANSDEYARTVTAPANKNVEQRLPAPDDKLRDRGQYVFHKSYVLQMGNTNSVGSFCRFSEFAQEVCARILNVVAVIYVDDTIIVETNALLMSGLALFCGWSWLIGMATNDKKNASTLMQRCIIALGLAFELSVDNKVLAVAAPPEKICRCRELFNAFKTSVDNATASFKDFRSTLGMCSYVGFSRRFRSGIELFRFCYPWTTEEKFDKWIKNSSMRANLVKHLNAIVCVLEIQQPWIFDRTTRRSTWHGFTDAAGERPSEKRGAALGGIGFGPKGKIYAWKKLFPYGYFDKYFNWRPNTDSAPCDDRPDINFFEILAEYIQVATFAQMLRSAFYAEHLDNTTACFSLVHGDAKSALATNVILASTFLKSSLDIQSYYSYTTSERNPSDALTRDEKTDVLIATFNPIMVFPHLAHLHKILTEKADTIVRVVRGASNCNKKKKRKRN